MTNMPKKWNRVYDGGMTMWYPQQTIIQFTARYLKKRLDLNRYKIKKSVHRILDVGCGNGSAVIFFTREGYKSYGIDISSSAIQLAKELLRKEKIRANLKIGDAKSLPYQDKFFDVVVSYGVLDHVRRKEADIIISEIKRVLKKGGLCCLSLISKKHSEYATGLKIEKNSYILKNNYEKGLVQHYFDLPDIQRLVRGWKIKELRLNYEDCLDFKSGKFTKDSARYNIVLKKIK